MNTPAHSDRERRLDEIATAWLKALEAGEHPDQQEWLQRYPDLAAELHAFFAAHQQVADIVPQRRENLPGPATISHEGAPDSTLGTIRYFGDYELLEELARGGMGVVFKARQVSLNRIVALKMILKGELATEAEVRRFRREAEAAANLDHPNIVPIYEVGEHEGQQYFSMKLIERGARDEGRGTSKEEYRRLAAALAKVAQAVHHAHQHGILHRDLKPNNILIDQQGEPHVVDFGLAKHLASGPASGGRKPPDDAPQHAFTQTGVIVGTPSYMAPEQVRGDKGVTTAVDVYSLGAVLYEWLTGKPPFAAATPLDTLLQVTSNDPTPPSKLQPKTPRDLEIICLKCLRKEPGKRYGSALELAEDLRRFERGEAILARRVGRIERAWRWTRRRPALAAAISMACLLLVISVIAASLLWRSNDSLTTEVAQRERQYRMAEYSKHFDRALSLWHTGDTAGARSILDGLNSELRGWEWDYLQQQCDRKWRDLGFASRAAVAVFGSSERLAATGHADGVVIIWNTLTGEDEHILRHPDSQVISLAFSGDEKHLAAAFTDGVTRVWETASGKMLLTLDTPSDFATAVAMNYDGSKLACGRTNEVTISDTATGRGLQEIATALPDAISIAFSPDNSHVACAASDGALGVWRIESDASEPILRTRQDHVRKVSFSPDGSRLLAYHAFGLQVWDFSTGLERVSVRTAHDLHDVVFAANRRWLFGCVGHEFVVWDANTGAQRVAMIAQPVEPGSSTRRSSTPVNICAIGNKSGRLLACFVTGHLALSEPQPNETAEVWSVPSTAPENVVFSKDGKRIVYSVRNSVKVRDAATGEVTHDLTGPMSTVWRAAFSPDGRLFATGGGETDGSWAHSFGGHLSYTDGDHFRETLRADRAEVKLWDRASGRELWTLPVDGSGAGVTGLAFSPNGKLLAAIDDGPVFGARTTVIDVATGRVLRQQKRHFFRLRSVVFSPDGTRLACCGQEVLPPQKPGQAPPKLTAGLIRLYDAATGETLLDVKRDAPFDAIDFTPDGKHFVAGQDGTISVWDTASGRLVKEFPGHRRPVRQMICFPDGERIASLGHDHYIGVWNWQTGKELTSRRLRPYQGAPQDNRPGEPTQESKNEFFGPTWMALSADGTRISVANNDLRSWNVAATDGEQTFAPWEVASWVTCLSLSRDGKWLLAGGWDHYEQPGGKVAVWSLENGQQVYIRAGHSDYVRGVAISPDGKRVASSADGRGQISYDSSVCVWDLESAREALRIRIPDRQQISAVVFGPNGHWLAAATHAHFLMGGSNATPAVRIWDATSGDELTVLRGHALGINDLALSRDGRWLVSAGQDKTVMLWDANARRRVGTFSGHNGPVFKVAITADGRRIASGAYLEEKQSGEFKIWDAATGRELASFLAHVGVWGLAFDPTGQRLATGGPTTRIEEFKVTMAPLGDEDKLGTITHTLRDLGAAEPLFSRGGTSAVKIWDAYSGLELLGLEPNGFATSVAFSPDGRRLVSATKQAPALKIWQASVGTEVQTFRGHEGARKQYIKRVAFSPDGSRIISCTDSGIDGSGKELFVWDRATGRILLRFDCENDRALRDVAVSPDGKLLATAHPHGATGRKPGSSAGVVRIWDAITGRQLRTLTGHTEQVEAVWFTPDSAEVFSRSHSGFTGSEIKRWEIGTGRELPTFRAAWGVTFSPNGQTVLGHDANGMRALDRHSGKEKFSLKLESRHFGTVYSPDGRSIAHLLTGPNGPSIERIDAGTGKRISSTPLQATHWGEYAVFSPDGRLLAAARGNDVGIWDGHTGKRLRILHGHHSPVYRLAFSSDGFVAATALDKLIKVWDVSDLSSRGVSNGQRTGLNRRSIPTTKAGK